MLKGQHDEADIARRLRELRDQLTALAQQLANAADDEPSDPDATDGIFRFSQNPTDERHHRAEYFIQRFTREAKPPLPDPRLVRRIIRQRQMRARFFDPELFADPAWDMLLDLTAARAEHTRVSVSSLCIASGVPPTTALRWINQMVGLGLLVRTEDDTDRRRAFVSLSDKGAVAMANYFREVSRNLANFT